jgi:uncharacterized protein
LTGRSIANGFHARTFWPGNIRETHMGVLVGSEQQRQFGVNKRETLFRTPDGEPAHNYLCNGYKAFFHHVDRPMRLMAERLRHGGAPADIMTLYAAEDSRLGRRDSCSCGSGRKWKACHGDARRVAGGTEP